MFLPNLIHLSITYDFAQVLVLTLSNLAMVPAVLLSLAGQLPVVGALLSVSAASSAVYHLCDIDVYCLGGLSFHSLQVRSVSDVCAHVSVNQPHNLCILC